MLDRERILTKLDELDAYLRELHALRAPTFEDYLRQPIATVRAVNGVLGLRAGRASNPLPQLRSHL